MRRGTTRANWRYVSAAVSGRAADDERRARLVDEDRVDLVHDAEGVAALDHVLAAHGHVVAQVVEAELGVGAVGDVGVVLRAALLRRHVGLDDADLEAEEAVHLAHPLGVALGQVVVDGDEVGAVAGEPLRYIGIVATSVLPSPVFISAMSPSWRTMPPSTWTSKGRMPSARLAASRATANASNSRSSSSSPFVVALAELGRLGAQLLVAQGGDVRLQLGDPLGLLLECLEAPAFTGVQQLVDDLDHWGTAPGISEKRSTPIVAQRAGRVARRAPGARSGRRARSRTQTSRREGALRRTLDASPSQFSAGSMRP